METVYLSPKVQELYRLVLCLCAATILLGAWRDLDYHWGLLAVITLLFVYQFGSYLINTRLLPNQLISRHRVNLLSASMELADGLIAAFLMALVNFDPLITVAIGTSFLITVVGAMKPTASLDIAATFAGALLGFWLLPITLAPTLGVQLIILVLTFAYCLLNVTMARHTHDLLADQHESVIRQNDWLTLRTFHLSKYLSPALRKAILTGKDVKAGTQEKTLTVFSRIWRALPGWLKT